MSCGKNHGGYLLSFYVNYLARIFHHEAPRERLNWMSTALKGKKSAVTYVQYAPADFFPFALYPFSLSLSHEAHDEISGLAFFCAFPANRVQLLMRHLLLIFFKSSCFFLKPNLSSFIKIKSSIIARLKR